MEGKLAAVPSYDEFEPFCQWQREESRDVLVIHLPEFKKDQLRVQINSRGILKLSGERALDADARKKISKFYKEVEVPKYCDTNGIQAKFANGCLYVIMPKLNKSSTEQTYSKATDDQKKSSEATEAPAAPEKKSAAEPAHDAGISKKETEQFPNTKAVGSTDSKDVITKSKGSISKMKICAKTGLNVAVAVAVLAALGSYFYYMYRSVVLHD